jgi:cytochrome c oxidase subunit 3
MPTPMQKAKPVIRWGSPSMSETSTVIAHQFDDAEQQREASTLGMWIFLATEVMFFGGIFLGYIIYRSQYSVAFAAASNRLDIWLGLINTAVLICSSFTMVLAVYNAAAARRRALQTNLLLTILLGCVFLSIKLYEYHMKFEENLVPGAAFAFPAPHAPAAEIFFSFYFAMTGMHAVHMIIGIGLLGGLLFRAGRGRYSPEYFTPVELVGLYWHFVDIVWIFLFPLLYLVGRHL